MFKKDIIFVVDISGSMRGKPLDDTRNAISAALSKLEPEDSFSIIAFNGETNIFSEAMELATKEAVERATQWMSANFIASGETNILHPLNQVSTCCSLFCKLPCAVFSSFVNIFGDAFA